MRGVVLLLCLAVLSGAPSPARSGEPDEISGLFERFVTAQNAHDLNAVSGLLSNRADFLWITRGTPIWGHDAALKRFEALYQGTWHLEPSMAEFKTMSLGDGAAQLFVPVTFLIAPAGQTAQPVKFLMNQTVERTGQQWRIVSILPIPLPQ